MIAFFCFEILKRKRRQLGAKRVHRRFVADATPKEKVSDGYDSSSCPESKEDSKNNDLRYVFGVPDRSLSDQRKQRLSKKVGQFSLIDLHCFFWNCPTCKVEGWVAFWSLSTSQLTTVKSVSRPHPWLGGRVKQALEPLNKGGFQIL